ncbi:MAG: VOC family protein [Fibrobacteria bacterium]|nr:VOC family protein [Fibrobacteria bacterium]
MFSRLAHVCLHVADLSASCAFYSRLGFSTKFRFTRDGKLFGAYLEIAPDQFLELFEDPARTPTAQGSLRHFCLETDDLDAVMAHLAQEGIPHTPAKKGCDDTWQIWMKDPDGNDFEVHAYTSTSRQRTGGDVEADW